MSINNKHTNFQEFEDYCNEYADVIFVREQLDGKWQSVALSDLDLQTRQKWIRGWYKQSRMPVRLKRDGELKAEGIDPLDEI